MNFRCCRTREASRRLSDGLLDNDLVGGYERARDGDRRRLAVVILLEVALNRLEDIGHLEGLLRAVGIGDTVHLPELLTECDQVVGLLGGTVYHPLAFLIGVVADVFGVAKHCRHRVPEVVPENLIDYL